MKNFLIFSIAILISFNAKSQSKQYKGSDTKINDLIHTTIDLKFDYKKKQATGKAEITLKPHYYKTDSLTLNARGFDIHKVQLSGKKNISLKYTYDSLLLKIRLNKTYNRNEEYKVLIEYTARPSDLKSRGGWAIMDDRGLYFIDPNSDNPQIWSQGETQSNSCWFPTIDSPIQKMTQDIYLTVKREYKTISNGLLINSLLNKDGTRTDHWKQDKPHAPYLTMLAIGKFEVLEDYWRDMKVFTFFPDGKIKQAKAVFGKTPKMIEFFSRILKYDYPWDKYYQVVVKDFVSGAMENTSASIFGSYVLNNHSEPRRIQNESVVAHELSHHWFGDLVTCESWANLPLNESFATYFEYLWIEHEYGTYEAGRHLAGDYRRHMMEANYADKNMIRFYYNHRDDMFDTYSYQKGSLILHMLRNIVGDDAFFDALSLYLNRKQYGTAEIHDLRMAFEEVTGKDMNIFFNQWFLTKGYPRLTVKYAYDKKNKTAIVNVTQTQKSKYPVYNLPVTIDLYYKDKTVRKKVVIDKRLSELKFYTPEKPLLINFDATNSILCSLTETKTEDEYIFQLKNAPLYKDKKNALKFFKYKFDAKTNKLTEALLFLLDHKDYEIRKEAMFILQSPKDTILAKKYVEKLKYISKNDPYEYNRTIALQKLKKTD